MRKSRWIIWIAIVVGTIPLVAYEQHHAREKYEAKREEACIQLSITFEQKYSCAKEAQSRHDYLPWWYILATWPEGITTWAIIATGFMIAWQSYETRRAANAQVDGNRAWIFADLEKIEGRGYFNGSSVTKDQEMSSATYLMVRLTFHNQGLSPAWIDGIEGHMEILPRKQYPPKRVEFTSFPYRPTVMVNGTDIINPDFECPGHLNKETDDLFIWIVIKYHDGHGMRGETSLGYGMSPTGMLFRQSNIPERNYNK